MIEILCDCSWEIPGVEHLPHHLHRRWAVIEFEGRRLRVPAHDIPLNPAWQVIDEYDAIHITVDWRKLARNDAKATTTHPNH